jgi:hypothetical protein
MRPSEKESDYQIIKTVKRNYLTGRKDKHDKYITELDTTQMREPFAHVEITVTKLTRLHPA